MEGREELPCREELSIQLDKDQGSYRMNFEQLELARVEAQERDYAKRPDDGLFEELSLSMSHGTDGSEQIETRHDILMQFLFEGVALEPFPTLDPQREFTREEKLILYHRAGGACQLSHNRTVCGRQVPFDEAAIDHIMPYSRGGKNSAHEWSVCCPALQYCSGNRDDFDPAKACLLIRETAPS